MKLTRLLAMLLALCMILCCFAACGSSDEDDEDEDEKVEDKDEKDEDEEDDEEDADEIADEDALSGKWGMIFDFSALQAMNELGEPYGGDTSLSPLSFVFEWDFDKDGMLTVTAIEFPAVDEAARFYEILFTYQLREYTQEDIDDMLAEEGYDELDEYIKVKAEGSAERLIETAREHPEVISINYDVEGNIITLGDGAEIEYNIFKDEMTFEKIEDEDDIYTMFEAHALNKQY